MKQTKEVITSWIELVNEEGRGLTKWEENFMESITEALARRGGSE